DVRSRKFLHADQHPAITFRSQRLANDGGTWTVHGILTARGTDAPLTLTVTAAAADGNALDLQAAGTVDRYAHGVTARKGMAGRWLHRTITVHATKSCPPARPAEATGHSGGAGTRRTTKEQTSATTLDDHRAEERFPASQPRAARPRAAGG